MYRLTDLIEEKKDKTGVSTLRSWIYSGKDLSEIQVAKAVSSTITHCLIEVEHIEDTDDAVEAAIGYHLDTLSTVLHNLIMGMTTVEISRRVILNLLKAEEKCDVPSGRTD